MLTSQVMLAIDDLLCSGPFYASHAQGGHNKDTNRHRAWRVQMASMGSAPAAAAAALLLLPRRHPVRRPQFGKRSARRTDCVSESCVRQVLGVVIKPQACDRATSTLW